MDRWLNANDLFYTLTKEYHTMLEDIGTGKCIGGISL